MTSLTLTANTPEWHALRKRALSDLFWFGDAVLGYGSLIPMTVPTHRLMCRFAERQTGSPLLDDAHYRLVSVPRGVGKTAAITITKTMQDSLRDPDGSTLLANENQLNANAFLSEIEGHFETNTFLRALFPDLIPDDPRKHQPWSAESLNLIRQNSRKEPTIFTVGVGGTKTGMHPDRIVVDDCISREAMENARVGSWQIMEKTNRWINQLRPLLNYSAPWWEICFIGCIAEGQRVLMGDGTWRAIQEIRVGEAVWSWDDKKQELVRQRVTGVWPQGVADTVTVRTDRHTLRCTPNHPLWSVKGTSVFSGKNEWRKAGDLTPGRYVQTIKTLPDVGEEDTYPDRDFLWLLGFMWGDGWVTKHTSKSKRRGTSWATCLALGVDEALNEYAVGLLRRYFPGTYTKRPGRYYRCDNPSVGRAFASLGLVPGRRAPEKRLPAWLWTLSPTAQRAFLFGLLDADGHEYPPSPKRRGKRGWRLSGASKGLMEDVREMALTCNMRPTAVWHRRRTLKPPGSPKPVVSDEYAVDLRLERDPLPLRKWRVKSVTGGVTLPVYDLSVEGTENFICEGFCVHNTRWWLGDSYEHVEKAFGYGESKRFVHLKQPLEDGSTQVIENVYRVGDLAVFKRAIYEHGQIIFPEKFTADDLAKLRMIDPELYAANYLNEPASDLTAQFKQAWLRYYTWATPDVLQYPDNAGVMVSTHRKDLDCLISIDPAFSEGHDNKSRQAIIVTGTDDKARHLILHAQATRQSVDAFIADIVSACKKYQPRKLLIERAGQQISFIMLVRERLRAAAVNVTIEEVTPGGTRKEMRIQTLEPYFQRGALYVERAMQDFLNEYASFPRGEFKDLLDALAYQAPFWTSGVLSPVSQSERMERELESLHRRMGMRLSPKKDPLIRADGSRR